MTEALGALSREELPDEDDLVAGPASFCAEILIEDPAWDAQSALDVADRVMHALVATRLAPAGDARCEIAFSSDAAVGALNGRFRGKDAPTNVLAFPSGEPVGTGAADASDAADEPLALGSVVLAYGVMHKEASERGIPLRDHTTHLTLHGLLHLLGYDHMVEAERVAMEAVEVEILAGLGLSDPYEGS
ncbi:MAG: rRNA maturation RNase YbeY [Acuticoccus sp.]